MAFLPEPVVVVTMPHRDAPMSGCLQVVESVEHQVAFALPFGTHAFEVGGPSVEHLAGWASDSEVAVGVAGDSPVAVVVVVMMSIAVADTVAVVGDAVA